MGQPDIHSELLTLTMVLVSKKASRSHLSRSQNHFCCHSDQVTQTTIVRDNLKKSHRKKQCLDDNVNSSPKDKCWGETTVGHLRSAADTVARREKGGNEPKLQDQEGAILIPLLLLLNWKLGRNLCINIALHPLFSPLEECWKEIRCNILVNPFHEGVITVKTEAHFLFTCRIWEKKESAYCLFGCG